MNPEFKYEVVYANDEGDKSSARFLNPRSAYLWARRLADEGFETKIKKRTQSGEINISLAELKKDAGPITAPKKKGSRIGKQLYATK